jgi:DNA-binding IclR family transcriptional regulator
MSGIRSVAPHPPRSRGGTLVLNKAVRILDLLLANAGRTSGSQVAAELGMAKSTAYRLLRSLETAGLVDRDGHGDFRLGRRLIRYGLLAEQGLELRREAQDPVRALSQATGQTSFVFVPHGWEAVCILRIPGRDIDVLAVAEQGSLPLHAGAGPKAILAAMPDEEIARFAMTPLPAFTDSTIVDHATLMGEIRETRARGYSRSWEDVTPGVGAFGAPILDARRSVAGSVSVGGITSHLESRLPEILQAVADCAVEVSLRLGMPRPASPNPYAQLAWMPARA